MFRDNKVKAQQIVDKTKILIGKSDDLANSASDFKTRASKLALASQNWKDFIRNLKEASEAYDKSQAIKDLEAYEVRLTEACNYLEAKLQAKKQVYKPKEINGRRTLLIGHREKIKAARMKPFDFLDDAPELSLTSSSTSVSTPSSSKKEDSPPSQKKEVTYTTISTITVPEGASVPVEEESFGIAFFRSFTNCCRPKAKIPDTQHYDKMRKRT
jgi:hypothetical protein